MWYFGHFQQHTMHSYLEVSAFREAYVKVLKLMCDDLFMESIICSKLGLKRITMNSILTFPYTSIRLFHLPMERLGFFPFPPPSADLPVLNGPQTRNSHYLGC